MEIKTFIFLSIACFCAAFLDSVAGGGGLISLPPFLLAGLPPQIALGTNKLAASFSSMSSSLKFIHAKKVNLKLIAILAPFSCIGAIIGVKLALIIDSKYLYPIVLGLLIFTMVYTLMNKKIGGTNEFKGITVKNGAIGSGMATILGCYDGFFGPGTGSFLIFSLIRIFKFDFIHASGTSKILNLCSNLVSVVIFVNAGKVNFFYAFSMAGFMFLGAQVGSRVAISKGTKFIKPIFIGITGIIIIKMVYDFIII